MQTDLEVTENKQHSQDYFASQPPVGGRREKSMYRSFITGKAISLCFLLLLVPVVSGAQGMTAAVEYAPGEKVPLTLTFDRAVQPTSFYCSFGLVGDPAPNQINFRRDFPCDGSFTKLTDTEYHLIAPVLENNPAGTYKLQNITLTLDGVSKGYQADVDFKPVTVAVRNSKVVVFPKIDSVVVPKK